MFCSKCGAETKKDSKFCAYCGNDLTAQAEKVKKQTKKEEEKVEEVKEVKEVKEETKTVSVPAPASNGNQQGGGKGTASLVLGIVSIVIPVLMLPLSIVGLILGIAEKQKDGKRTAGIIINAIELGLSLIASVFIFFFIIAIGAEVEDYERTSRKNIWDIVDKYEKNVTSDVKVVGDSKYGYTEVPKTWNKYVDSASSGMPQYASSDKKYILTLNVYDNDLTPYKASQNVYDHMKEKYNITPSRSYTTIDKKFAYVVSGYYSAQNKYIDTYLFTASDGKLHYIAIEGPDKNDESFKIPKTFKMEK